MITTTRVSVHDEEESPLHAYGVDVSLDRQGLGTHITIEQHDGGGSVRLEVEQMREVMLAIELLIAQEGLGLITEVAE